MTADTLNEPPLNILKSIKDGACDPVVGLWGHFVMEGAGLPTWATHFEWPIFFLDQEAA